jgi:hypothetical protein
LKIQLKRSNVLADGKAKTPTAGQMEYGELAVNYNTLDPAMFIKDSANNIIRISNMNGGLIPDITDPNYQADTLDDRYLSLTSWANVPDLSTAP